MGVVVREKEKDSGIYWVFINHNGRRSSKRVGTENAAMEVKDRIDARLKLGESAWPKPKPKTPTLDEYFTKFARVYFTALRPSTRESYQQNFKNHILPHLGKFQLDEIEREKIKDFVADLREKKFKRIIKNRIDPKGESRTIEKNYSKETIRLILAALRAVLNQAMDDKIIQYNPATRLGKFYKQAPKVHEEVEPLTHEEVPKFLQSAMENFPEFYPLFLCAVHTGLRSGELAGLQWGDVDFNGKFLTVRRGVVEGKVFPTKTGKNRRVDLSDVLITTLLELKRERKKEYLAMGSNEIPEWVFSNEVGSPLDMHNVKSRYFYNCLEKAKLRRIRFHDLRHTFASLLIQNGESLTYVKEQLGHSSIKMTVDVYGHLVPGANRQAVNRLPSLRDAVKEAKKSRAAKKNLG